MPGAPSLYYGGEWALEGKKQNGSDAPLRPCLELSEMLERDQSLCAHLAKLSAIRAAMVRIWSGTSTPMSIRSPSGKRVKKASAA